MRGDVRVSSHSDPHARYSFTVYVDAENGVPMTKMDNAAILAAVRRELRKRGFTVKR